MDLTRLLFRSDFPQRRVLGDDSRILGLLSEARRPQPVEFACPLEQLAGSFSRANPERRVWSLMSEKVRQAEVFDFGAVNDVRLASESRRGGELYYRNYLRLPFECVLYWYKFTGNEAVLNGRGIPAEHHTVRFATIALDGTRAGLPSTYGRLVAVADFVMGGEGLTISSRKCRTTMYLACAGALDVKNEKEYIGRTVAGVTKTSETSEKSAQNLALSGLADGVFALTMMLSTRGIPMRREEVSPKLNRKRAQANKPPLARVTYVDTVRYYEALENTERGEGHASPVPHLRRGHPRKYRDGTETWVRDALVNCRRIEEIAARDHYQVQQ